MNASAFGTAARTVALAIVLALAAASGLIVGNLIQGRDTNADGGATVPVSRTADATFSLRALGMLQQLRMAEAGDENAAPAAPEYVDYARRQAAEQADEDAAGYVDYGVRHITPMAFTDTFRLTGPSQLDDDSDG